MDEDDDFALFAAARWSTLYRLAYLLTGSRPAAEDLLQLSLEKVYVKWSHVRRMDAPDAYLRKVMVNAAVAGRRRLARRREVLSDRTPDLPSSSPEREVLDHQLLWPLVCALPSRQRAVIVLRFYEDLTEAAVAELLGCSVGTVKSQSHDAVQALRRGIAAAGDREVVNES